MIAQLLKNPGDWIERRTEAGVLAYLVLLFLFFALFLLSLSIRYTDTDLWYHLAGGRYLLAEGALFNPVFYSYIDEPRDFINYFWGFQVLAFGTWSVAGEVGLILLKAGLLFCSGLLAAHIICAGRPLREAGLVQLLVLAIVIGLLCLRGFGLRPHLASLVFIPLFILVLGHREKLYPTLPLLTVCWVNLHGVEWVVGALICGAWFLQRLQQQLQQPDAAHVRAMIWIGLCLPAMFVNPSGYLLLLTPFAHDPGLEQFILELAPLVFSADLAFGDGARAGLLILLLAMAVFVSFILTLGQWRQHLAAILMAVGGLVLLMMAKRFVWEWALLSLPIVAAGLGYRLPVRPGPGGAALLLAVLCLLPMTWYPTMRDGMARYPLDRESLPWATTEFIQRADISGRYAIEPSYAGYIEFMLAPAVEVHMDMQFPPFTSMDIHDFNSAMHSAGGFERYVTSYRPAMVGVKKSNRRFPLAAARALGYVPVFFDQKVVLLLDQQQYPQLAESNQLRFINPFDQSVIPLDDLEQGIAELERMLQQVNSDELRITLTALLIEQGRLDQAASHVEQLVRAIPSNLSTRYYQARIAHLQGDCEAALGHYEEVIDASRDPALVHRWAAECYFLTGDLKRAYSNFSLGIDPYEDRSPDLLAYYQFALSAVGAAQPEEAIRLLSMIGHIEPDHPVTALANDLLASMTAAAAD